MHKLPYLRLALLLAAMSLAGCHRPPVDLGYVEGRVTVDGEPLEHVTIIFAPESGGRPSVGMTNSNGEYLLYHTSNYQGAELGGHNVKLRLEPNSKYFTEDPLINDPRRLPSAGPGDIALGTEATQTVETGSQRIDFELSAKQLPKP